MQIWVVMGHSNDGNHESSFAVGVAMSEQEAEELASKKEEAKGDHSWLRYDVEGPFETEN